MKILSDALQDIATTLGVDYIRSVHLTDADVDVHFKASTSIMIYNGLSNIETIFEGAQIVDQMDASIYFLTKKTTKDITGLEADNLLEITKRMADQTYAILNAEYAVKDIAPWSLQAVESLTDLFIGHMMTISVPFNNTGC